MYTTQLYVGEAIYTRLDWLVIYVTADWIDTGVGVYPVLARRRNTSHSSFGSGQFTRRFLVELNVLRCLSLLTMVRPHLSWLVTIVVMMTVVSSIRGDCAAVHPNCYCSGSNIYCKDMGAVSQVPTFKHSNTVYRALVISGNTTLSTVQTGAFNGLKVEQIFLSSIAITAIQSGAFSDLSDTLESLYLDHNKLETMPEDVFGGLGQLKNLYLPNNQFKTVIPAWFNPLPALEHLSLSLNQFETIPDKTFNKLHKLRKLELSANQLKTVSAVWFSQLTALETLYFDNNQFESIPDDTFKTLNQLVNLYLYGNRLNKLSKALFSHTPALQILHLGGNHLRTIPDDTFDDLHQLKYLSLWYNFLTTVKTAWFRQLTNLETLKLSLNQFETIPEDAFEGLNKLKTLELNHYRLKTLSYALVQNKPHLESLTLYGNPLECDCRLAWVRTMADILSGFKALCASPPSVKETPVVAYDISMCNATTTETGIS